MVCNQSFTFFFFNDTATTEIYTLSLHDALPISPLVASCDTSHVPFAPSCRVIPHPSRSRSGRGSNAWNLWWKPCANRSEEHTSELQSRSDLVCRLLLEKKNQGALMRGYPYLPSE